MRAADSVIGSGEGRSGRVLAMPRCGQVSVVVAFVLANGVEQMDLVEDQSPVQWLVGAGLDPAFHERVHAGEFEPVEHDGSVRHWRRGAVRTPPTRTWTCCRRTLAT